MARKEMLEHLRSKRLWFIGGAFALTFAAAVVIGILLNNEFPGRSPDVVIGDTLVIYFQVGLIGGATFVGALGLILSADAIAGEWKERSLFLLLSKPVSRSAILTGKILASYLMVLGVFVPILLLSVVALTIGVGAPSSDFWGRLFLGLLLVIAAIPPFVGLGIMFSTITRSTVSSFVFSILTWFLIFPIISTIGFFIDFFRGINQASGEPSALAVVLGLTNPTNLLRSVTMVWSEDSAFAENPLVDDLVWVFVAILIHSVAYFGISYWMVARRDYE